MEQIKSKPLFFFAYIPLAVLIFIRPFISGLAYQTFEFYYELCLISVAVITLSFSILHGETFGFLQRIKDAYKKITGYLPVLLLLSAYLISSARLTHPENSTKETLKLISYICVFYMTAKASDCQKKTIIKAIIIGAIIVSAYSIYQYFWGYQSTLDYLKKTSSNLLVISSYAKDILIDKRAIGTFPSPNILGSYLLIAFFLSLHTFFSNKKLFKILPAVIILIALALTKSLGAWLTLIVCFVIIFFFFRDELKKRKLLSVAYFIIILSAIAFILANRWERLMNIENPHNSITQRINYWRTGIAIIKDHPFLGIGPGNFQEVFLNYKTGLSANTKYAHNIFLHTWAETGIPGLIGMFLLIYTFFLKAAVKYKYIFLAGLAFILYNLIDVSYFIPETGLFFWILLGLADNRQSK